MRLRHPVSIQEAVAGHKERVKRLDPRFDVKVSLADDAPVFTLLAKEEVPITFEFAGDPKEMEAKLRDMLEKGALVAFKPGEVKVAGTKLLEPFWAAGGAMQCSVDLPATLTLVAKDAEGQEVGRLADMPGHLNGGMKESWYDGSFSNAPLTVKLGPITRDKGGSVQLNLALNRWDGQRVLQLAHFERINTFFQALPKATTTWIDCQQDGNGVFSVETPLETAPFAAPLARYLGTVAKARRVAQRFGVNPVWGFETFDRDAQETAEELFAIFFGSGWSQPRPRIRYSFSCVRKTFRFDRLKEAKGPIPVRLTSTWVYGFMGEKIEVRLVHDYTEMTMCMKRDTPKSKALTRRKGKKAAGRRKVVSKSVEVVMTGTEKTVMSVRIATEDDEATAK
jgi:hypothetical protein